MVSDQLLSILVCPETKQSLRLASSQELDHINRRILSHALKNRVGGEITEPLTAALVREDAAVAYPIRDDIPIMLIEESFVL